MRLLQRDRASRATPSLRRRTLALGALIVCACGPARPDRAKAPGYAGDDDTGGGEASGASTDIDDDEYVRGMFLEVGDAPRIRTCAPARAPWVIIAYAPEVLDAHRVRTREVHCSERVISERCKLVADVRFYLEDPEAYFSVAPGVKPERALQLAELSDESSQGGRLLGVAADKGGVYLLTRGECGTETQVAVRLKGEAAARRLELIETRYSVAL